MKRFETKIRVQYYETDKMGIVHHSNYVRYLETARTELFRIKGMPTMIWRSPASGCRCFLFL